jgi:hypothetical protein
MTIVWENGRETAGPSPALRSGRDDNLEGRGPPGMGGEWMDRFQSARTLESRELSISAPNRFSGSSVPLWCRPSFFCIALMKSFTSFSDTALPCFRGLQMPPLSMVTFWTFQLREWRNAFWAYRRLLTYRGSSVWDNPFTHRRPTRRAGLQIPGLFTQLLSVNSRANVCFHEVTPLAWRINHYSPADRCD